MRKQPESEMPQAQHEKKAIDTTALAIASADTDKDGLKDWEETLWKTDPKNKDRSINDIFYIGEKFGKPILKQLICQVQIKTS